MKFKDFAIDNFSHSERKSFMTFGLNEMCKCVSKLFKDKKIKDPLWYKQVPKVLCDGMIEALLVGGKIRLERVGVIEVKVINGRRRRNPKTGEIFCTDTKYGLRFKPSRHIYHRLNNVAKATRRRKRLCQRNAEELFEKT